MPPSSPISPPDSEPDGAPVAIAGLVSALRGRRSVTLLANNPALTPRDLAAVPCAERDAVVHFNRAPFLPRFLSGRHLNVLVLRQHFDTGRFHGWPTEARTLDAMRAAPERFHLLLCLNDPRRGALPDPGAVPRSRFAVDDPAVRDGYPLVPDIAFAAPSTGFAVLMLLRAHGLPGGETGRWHRALVRLGLARPRGLLLCGFFDTPEGRFWPGHSWAHERARIAGQGLRDLARR